MRITPANCVLIGEGLDHPESVCLAPDGVLYAGGEAGQVYRIQPDGTQHIVGSTGGFLLGIVLDGRGNIHACDVGKQKLSYVRPDGTVADRATAVGDRPFSTPNHGVFDQQGNFYMSDSGDYWHTPGTGCIVVVDMANQVRMFHEGPFSFANGVALDPAGEWLYVAQSTASNIVRIPIDRENGPVEVTHTLPAGTVPDGIAFAADGRLVIGCYKPDAVFAGHLDGTVELLYDDPTGELLSRPTNIAIGDGRLYISNLGGWHLTSVECDLQAALIHRPILEI